MAFDLIRRVESLGRPRLLVVGDLILDRYIWGDAERISQEAPVPLLRADAREHRLGGASSVATMLATLGAQVRLVGGVGRDPEAGHVRLMLDDLGINHDDVVALDDRPTTLKERYIGRAQDRHPQQMIRVDYETRDPLPAAVEAELIARLPAAVAGSDLVLISDYDKGVCTPKLLRALIDTCRAQGRAGGGRPDPGVGLFAVCRRPLHDAEPARSGLATGRTIRTVEEAIEVGRTLVATARDGRDPGDARPRRDGPGPRRWAEPRSSRPAPPGLRHHRRGGHGPLDRRPLPGRRGRLRRGRRAGERRGGAGGREDRRRPPDPARDPAGPDPAPAPEAGKLLHDGALLAEVARRRALGQKIVFTNGCFDILHVGHARLLRQAKAEGDALDRRGSTPTPASAASKGRPDRSTTKTPAPSCSARSNASTWSRPSTPTPRSL